MHSDNPYDVLNVHKTSTPDEIKKAFKKLAIEHHPDKTAGDKQKEEQFKKINEAYSILSDPQKRETYDRFGIVDPTQRGGQNIDEILRSMFGGGGGFPGGGFPGGGGFHGGMGPGMAASMGGGPGGFSFVFMNGDEDAGGFTGGHPFGDIFGQFFGGGGDSGDGHRHQTMERVDIPVTIADIHHGTTKKAEFELLDMCSKCQGTGASDPSHIINCMICKGEGKVARQVNPFMMTMVNCDSCGGKGSTIKNNKVCTHCKGEKTQYTKKTFELNIPKGIPHNHEVRMNGKGAWNPKTKQHGSMIFRFVYDIKAPYSLHGLDVHYNLDITIDELMCGFEKDITMYNEKIKLVSKAYFNPTKPYVERCKGLTDPRHQRRAGDFIINFNVKYEDNSRLSKYTDILQKVFKRKAIEDPPSTEKSIILS